MHAHIYHLIDVMLDNVLTNCQWQWAIQLMSNTITNSRWSDIFGPIPSPDTCTPYHLTCNFYRFDSGQNWRFHPFSLNFSKENVSHILYDFKTIDWMDLPSVAFALFFLVFDIQVLTIDWLGGYLIHASNKSELKPSTDHKELE